MGMRDPFRAVGCGGFPCTQGSASLRFAAPWAGMRGPFRADEPLDELATDDGFPEKPYRVHF